MNPLQKFVLRPPFRASKDQVLCLLIAAMWAGLLWSRALLSISMITLVVFVAFLVGREWKSIQWRPSMYPFSLMLLFLLPLVSGLWTDDRQEWLRTLQVKMPLFFLPLLTPALASIPSIDKKKLCYLLGFMLLISMSKSLLIYLSDPINYSEAYLKAKVLPVDMSGDHLRLSWLLNIVYAWALHLLLGEKDPQGGNQRRGLLLMALAIGLFQHLLAAKTGLLGLYLVTLLAIGMHFNKRAMKVLLGLVILLPLLAWLTLPTFRNRVKFVRWDFQHYSQGKYREGLSDAQRVISWQAGLDIWKQKPLLGIGYGDVREATRQWHVKNETGMKDYEIILPSNQFLMYADGAGIAGLLTMGLAAFLPFAMRPHRKYFAWLSFHLLALFGFLYENGLEGQYGVFIYAFLGSWLWVELSRQGSASEKETRSN